MGFGFGVIKGFLLGYLGGGSGCWLSPPIFLDLGSDGLVKQPSKTSVRRKLREKELCLPEPKGVSGFVGFLQKTMLEFLSSRMIPELRKGAI